MAGLTLRFSQPTRWQQRIRQLAPLQGQTMGALGNLYSGSVPALYDRYRGQTFFQPYANDLANRVTYLTAGRLLETAAGTGILTRVLARLLPQRVTLVATDVSLDMIKFAAAQGKVERVVWGKWMLLHFHSLT